MLTRPIDWVDAAGDNPGHVALLDQTALPDKVTMLQVDTVELLVDAIHRLAVRGAPALGVAGGFGVALAVQTLPPEAVPDAVALIRNARPTAVNLAVGADLVAAEIPHGFEAVLARAKQLRDDEIAASTRMARLGADELYRELGDATTTAGLRLMTICNTGGLAAVERGTALGVIEEVLRDGKLRRVYPCETRPLLQGSRLTAWELQQMNAPFDLIVDSAAASTIRRGFVDAVLVGADRVAANGDSANKIGTFSLALAAKYAGIPFYVVAPETTVDIHTANGEEIEIEDRGSAEVCTLLGVRTAPVDITALNPAFDVTPAELITAIITDQRVIHPQSGERPDDPLPGANS